MFQFRIWLRTNIFLLFFIYFLGICCSCGERTKHQISKEEAIEICKTVVIENDLISQPIDCVSFEIGDEKNDGLYIHVREKHSQDCPGDPSTSVRLFTLMVNLKSLQVLSDVNSIDGTFQPLRRPPN